jgi:hypothetical protein
MTKNDDGLDMYYQLTDARIHRITTVLGAAPLIAIIFSLAFGERSDSSLFSGDFPAFYAAAEIVWTGRGTELYDYSLQQAIENHHWPDFDGSFYIYAYPPFFAFILSPLASIQPLFAKTIFSGFLLICLIVSLILLRATSLFVQRYFLFSLFYLLSLVPVTISIIGCQNTALSILIFTLAFWADRSGKPVLMGFFCCVIALQTSVWCYFIRLSRFAMEKK